MTNQPSFHPPSGEIPRPPHEEILNYLPQERERNIREVVLDGLLLSYIEELLKQEITPTKETSINIDQISSLYMEYNFIKFHKEKNLSSLYEDMKNPENFESIFPENPKIANFKNKSEFQSMIEIIKGKKRNYYEIQQ